MELIRRDYFANEGWETFLSYEDPEQDILVGLLRLRKPSNEAFRFDKDRTFESFIDATAESFSYTTTEKCRTFSIEIIWGGATKKVST